MRAYQKLNLKQAVEDAIPKRRIELTEIQIERLRTTSKIILGLLLTAGAITLAVAAPNAVRLLGFISPKLGIQSKEFRARQKQKVVKALYYLRTQKDIELIPQGKTYLLKITQKGRGKIRPINFQNLFVAKSERWNRHWWFVLADIPTKTHKSAADQLRRKLKEMDFYPLQRTVWVYPYDPRDEIDFINNYYDLSQFVTVLEASALDPSDQKLLYKHFKAKNII